jgi:predicted RNA methylase
LATSISNDVIDVLARSEFNDTGLKLPGTPGGPDALPRDLYMKTDKVLKACGLKWNRSAGRHLGDATEVVEQAILTGQYTDAKVEFQAYYTPPELAEYVVEKALIQSGMTVLEPSAGHGALVHEILSDGGMITAFEIDAAAREVLFNKFPDLLDNGCGVNFMESQIVADFDRVVMNPPFAKSQEVHHVMRAMDHVKVGGRLVSIMTPGIRTREGAYTALRNRLESDKWGYRIEDLPENSFKSSGTGVRTVLLIADRYMP